MKRLILCVAVLLCGLGQVQADVEVVVGNIEFGPSSWEEYDYQGLIYQDAAGTDHTSVLFDFDGSNLQIMDLNMDEGSDWYLVNEGDQFSRENIDNGLFPVLISPDTRPLPGPPVFVGSEDFYLGVNTGQDWVGIDESGNLIPARDVYGWVHISYEFVWEDLDLFFGDLVQLDDATAYGAEGIIVGTTQAIVPEPSTITLLLTGALGLLACARRRRRTV